MEEATETEIQSALLAANGDVGQATKKLKDVFASNPKRHVKQVREKDRPTVRRTQKTKEISQAEADELLLLLNPVEPEAGDGLSQAEADDLLRLLAPPPESPVLEQDAGDGLSQAEADNLLLLLAPTRERVTPIPLPDDMPPGILTLDHAMDETPDERADRLDRMSLKQYALIDTEVFDPDDLTRAEIETPLEEIYEEEESLSEEDEKPTKQDKAFVVVSTQEDKDKARRARRRFKKDIYFGVADDPKLERRIIRNREKLKQKREAEKEWARELARSIVSGGGD